MEEPPITARITHTNKVVREVTMVRLKHWFIDLLMVSAKLLEPYTAVFSRIRSKFTIVSFTE